MAEPWTAPGLTAEERASAVLSDGTAEAGRERGAVSETRIWPMLPGYRGGAMFDGPGDCYRIWLTRHCEEPFSDRTLLAIGLNPSTATAEVDDPTIRKELGYAARLDCDSYTKMNLSPLRSTDPKGLVSAFWPVRPDGYVDLIRQQAHVAAVIFCGWGDPPAQLKGLPAAVRSALKPYADRCICIGLNASGNPKHPLYARADAEMVAFRP